MKMQAFATVAAGALSLFTAAVAQATTVGLLAGLGPPAGGVDPRECIPGLACELIPYNNSIPDPTGAIPAIVQWTSIPGNDIVGGLSLGGANISTCIQIQCAPLDTVFYTYGNPFFGSTPSSPYQLTEVVHEYDPAADPPDQWWNLLAVINALASGQHANYAYAEISDPNAVRWSEGNVDYVLIPDAVFPLTASWDPVSQAFWTPILKPIVDSAYTSRPIPSPTTTVVATAPVASSTTWVTTSSTDATSASSSAPQRPTTHKSASTGKSPTTGAPKKSSASNGTAKKSTHPVTKKAAGTNTVKPTGKKPKVDR